MAIQTGSYIKFKSVIYVVTKTNANGTIQIINPMAEGVDSKKSISEANAEVMPYPPMKEVTYKGKRYLVSVKGLIISLATKKPMKWGEENGDRKAILALAK